ncbi:DUF7282 domain-containing protein [Haloarchaeobius sp. HRN-SO-5]|uniref:DUF7282 domain-containing protein n=1 Tax=Haloarchaeobius sp. HRN-SO-5 TaxID=3446118 RepID=UPI003EB939C6
MSRSPQFVAAVTMLVVSAAVLPVAIGAVPSTLDAAGDEPTTNRLPSADDSTVVRLHAVPDGTDPTDLPDRVGVDAVSDDVFISGEPLVVSVQSSALAETVENASGETLTDRFVAAQSSEPRLRVVQKYPTPERLPVHVDLSDAANLTVVPGDGPTTFHVVLDTRNVTVTRGEPGSEYEHDPRPMSDLYGGKEFGAGVGEHDATAEITLLEPDATVDTGDVGRLFATPGEELSVTGTTTLRPNESVTVELVKWSTVFDSQRVSLAPTGNDTSTEERSRFDVDLGLGDTEDGESLGVRVRDGETVLDGAVDVTVRNRSASLTFEDDTVRTGVLVENVSLSHGGFVVLERADGTVVDSTRFVYPSEAAVDAHLDIRPELDARGTYVAVAYRDVDDDGEFGDEDVPYRRNGSPVTDTAVLRPPNRTTTPTTSTPAPTTAPPTQTPAEPTATDPAETAPVPGFGVLPAVAALLALAFLRRP